MKFDFSNPSRLRQMFEPSITRAVRQARVALWCREAFGDDQAASVPQRGVRLLEETIEAYQSAGGTAEMAHRLVDFVFSREAGKLNQELGGVGITLLALCEAAELSAEGEEIRELNRVLAKPPEHFTERNEEKNRAGFEVAK